MRIFPGERRVRASVRELAEFRLGSPKPSRSPAGAWRAQLGREWHAAMQEEEQPGADDTAQAPGDEQARHEVSIRGVLLRDGWSIELEGRMDKLTESIDQCLVTEFKTTFTPLPASEERLREKYPHYFLQVAVYLTLLRLKPEQTDKTLKGELLFADLSQGGFLQTVPLDEGDEADLEQRIEALLCFLEERRRSRERLTNLKITPPFENMREGQNEARDFLNEGTTAASVTLFEAPTGFGKTGMTLSFALERLRDGLCERVLYLTGKSTGQNEVARTLKTMVPDEEGIRYLILRNRSERNAGFEDLANLSAEDLSLRWEAASLDPSMLFRQGTLSEEDLRETASRIGIPPYEIIRAALPYADLWVGDFNYVFHPGSASFLQGVDGHDSARSLLVADEAHNLPERAAGALSVSFRAENERLTAEDLAFAKTPRRLVRAIDEWADFLENRTRNEILDPDDFLLATELVESTAEAIRKGPLPWSELSAATLENLRLYGEAANLLGDDSFPKRCWAPSDAGLQITCLDASSHVGARLRSHALSFLTSATLAPVADFAASCGLAPEEYRVVRGEAPWRRDSLRVAIDLRGDTRYSRRRDHLDATVSSILTLVRSSERPVAVFFPSFRYAGEVRDHLRERSSPTRALLQPRFDNLAEANEFLEVALRSSEVLFLVLGSVFSEGIDNLGGRVDAAMVVGPALPEVNPLQEAKMEAWSALGRNEAFRRTYLIPGLRKVNQALGRLARSPEHRARVLLHCRRFGQPAYRELLDPVCADAPFLRSPDELASWLAADQITIASPEPLRRFSESGT